jgi:hypothetical protein
MKLPPLPSLLPQSSLPLLVVVALLGLVTILYHEDVIVFTGGRRGSIEDGRRGTPHEDKDRDEDRYWNALIHVAKASDYACTHASLPTSIHATIASANAGDSLAVSLEDSDVAGTFLSLALTFRAYDEELRPQQSGGDVFVVDYQSSWSSATVQQPLGGAMHEDLSGNYTVFKSSTFTRDHLDGTYSGTLLLPRAASDRQHVHVSLRHYYACHEGLKLPRQLKVRNGYRTLTFGPLPWEAAAEEVRAVLRNLPRENATAAAIARKIPVTTCSENPNDEYILRGAWVEEHAPGPPAGIVNMTLDARWTPFHCAPDSAPPPQKRTLPAARRYRIGDSTLPGRIVASFSGEPGFARPGLKRKIGMPYAPYLPNYRDPHDQFLEVLRTYRREYNGRRGGTPDTFMYSGGLHHLLYGQFGSAPTAALILRLLCQAGLTFPGKIFLRGPNPLQQHQHPVVDVTSLNVRRVNWELRARLRDAGRRLADVCSSLPAAALASFVALAGEDGALLPDAAAAPRLLRAYNYSWERDSTRKQKRVSEWIRGLSGEERRARYGNRKVRWIDLEGFLLSRPEVYRKNDKIHDSIFFFGPEWDMLSAIEGYE